MRVPNPILRNISVCYSFVYARINFVAVKTKTVAVNHEQCCHTEAVARCKTKINACDNNCSACTNTHSQLITAVFRIESPSHINLALFRRLEAIYCARCNNLQQQN